MTIALITFALLALLFGVFVLLHKQEPAARKPSEAELAYLRSARPRDFIITKTGHILHVVVWGHEENTLYVTKRSILYPYREEVAMFDVCDLAGDVDYIIRFNAHRHYSEQAPEFRFIDNGYFSEIPDKSRLERWVVDDFKRQFPNVGNDHMNTHEPKHKQSA